MAEAPNMRLWVGRAIYVTIGLILIFFSLLPLDAQPDVLPWPDLLILSTLVWVARRPDYTPVLAIGFLFFLTDLLFQRPPGLWTALVILLTESIRKRAIQLRNAPVLLEWGTIALGIVAITLAYRAILFMALTPTAPLGLTLLQLIMTIACYPVVGILAHYVFGVDRPAPGATDSLGHRL